MVSSFVVSGVVKDDSGFDREHVLHVGIASIAPSTRCLQHCSALLMLHISQLVFDLHVSPLGLLLQIKKFESLSPLVILVEIDRNEWCQFVRFVHYRSHKEVRL